MLTTWERGATHVRVQVIVLRRLVVRVLQLQHVRPLHQVGILLLLVLLLLLLEVLLLLLLLRVGRRPRRRDGRVREAPSLLLLLLLQARRRQRRMHRILSEVATTRERSRQLR